MSVYTKLREKAAKKISYIDTAETFNWNKWLRAPVNEDKEIKQLDSEFLNTEKIILKFEIPVNTFFNPNIQKIKILKSSSKAFKIKSRTNPIFFQFGISRSFNIDISYKQELKHFFSTEIIHDKTSTYFKIKNLKRKEVTKQLDLPTKNIPILIKQLESNNNENTFTKNINFEIPINVPRKFETEIFTFRTAEIDFLINTPNIIDYLSKLIPKIYKIGLLNSFEEIISYGKNYQIKVELLDTKPSIFIIENIELVSGNILSTAFQNKMKIRIIEKKYFEKLSPYDIFYGKTYSPKFFAQQEILFAMNYKPDSTQPNSLVKNFDSDFVEDINKLLQPEINLSEDEVNEIFKYLLPYQNEGAKFLIDNHTSCLADELGLDKRIEVIAAIKYLIKKREIKTVLILSQKYFLRDKKFNLDIGNFVGWEGYFQKFAPELKTIIIDSNPEELKENINQSAQIFFINYELIFEGLITNSLDDNSIKKFDCICYDDSEILNEHMNNFERLLKLSNAKYTWLLTNQPKNIFHEKFLQKFRHIATLERNKNQVSNQIPSINSYEFWVELDKDQKLEYDQAYVESQSQIWNVLQTGNPYRLQAIVFTILHRLKQITNFSLQKISSNKTELLVLHLNSIKSFNHKAIVFSQYDKFGTQRLIDLFKQKDIKYVSNISGTSSNEIELSVKKFKEDKSVNVFLASSKEAVGIIAQVKADYIIYFDQWWIPVTQWQLEEKIKNLGWNVHILNYFSKNTIEENIRLKLIEKDLLNKKATGNIGADSFSKQLTEKDWLEVFNVVIQKNEKNDKEEIVEDPSSDS